jgi:phosphatidylglycerol:prolipoprotein diacylglycerol transferase
MHPELFEIPFVHLTVKSYGLMMVIGFLCAVLIIRRLSRYITPDPRLITNACLYALMAGVVGSRLFYVVHHFEQFRGSLLSVFAIWKGGLEFFGGVILATVVIVLFLGYHKVAMRRYLDILAIGLMAGLAFGRIGCFLKGDCFGRPTNLPWGVRFPCGSDPYRSQVHPDFTRNRSEPHLELPPEFFDFYEGSKYLKPYERLTQEQQWAVTQGQYRCLPVHPTQLYSSANALLGWLLLYFFWRRSRNAARANNVRRLFSKPGCTVALMFMFYGATRFVLELLRDDNPFEDSWWILCDGKTISQNLGIYMFALGGLLIAIFQKVKPDTLQYGPEVLVTEENDKIAESA